MLFHILMGFWAALPHHSATCMSWNAQVALVGRFCVGFVALGRLSRANSSTREHWSETCLGSGPDPVAGVDPCLGGVKLESMAWI